MTAIFNITILDTIAITLALIHFGVPLTYYWYMKTKYLNKPWNIKTNPNYKPKVTIIVPTYNEAKLIWKKLDNLAEQTYPKNLTEIIVIDSASTDGTPEIVRKWIEQHPNINIKLIQEPERKGKAHALNHALQHATGEIVVITDADCWWPKNALQEAVKWLSDPTVGAVSCIKKPATPHQTEETYRKYYNTLRIAESKAYSTPIFHGELAAYKKNLLLEIGGFPTNIGADDSHTATRIALIGRRAIIPGNLEVKELIPEKDYPLWRIRRAQHLIQHFKHVLMLKIQHKLKAVLYAEMYLHLINPLLLLSSSLILLISAFMKSFIAITLLIAGMGLLLHKSYETWIKTQIYLIIAMVRNIWTKEIIWQ